MNLLETIPMEMLYEIIGYSFNTTGADRVDMSEYFKKKLLSPACYDIMNDPILLRRKIILKGREQLDMKVFEGAEKSIFFCINQSEGIKCPLVQINSSEFTLYILFFNMFNFFYSMMTNRPLNMFLDHLDAIIHYYVNILYIMSDKTSEFLEKHILWKSNREFATKEMNCMLYRDNYALKCALNEQDIDKRSVLKKYTKRHYHCLRPYDNDCVICKIQACLVKLSICNIMYLQNEMVVNSLPCIYNIDKTTKLLFFDWIKRITQQESTIIYGQEYTFTPEYKAWFKNTIFENYLCEIQGGQVSLHIHTIIDIFGIEFIIDKDNSWYLCKLLENANQHNFHQLMYILQEYTKIQQPVYLIDAMFKCLDYTNINLFKMLFRTYPGLKQLPIVHLCIKNSKSKNMLFFLIQSQCTLKDDDNGNTVLHTLFSLDREFTMKDIDIISLFISGGVDIDKINNENLSIDCILKSKHKKFQEIFNSLFKANRSPCTLPEENVCKKDENKRLYSCFSEYRETFWKSNILKDQDFKSLSEDTWKQL